MAARRDAVAGEELTVLTTAIIVLPLLAVRMHYEFLVLTSKLVQALSGHLRAGVAMAVTLALAAHVVEVIVFGIGWFVLIEAELVEVALPDLTMVDAIYFSGAVYTSLGFGDIVPVSTGGKFLAVLETITGLVLIAWTASFTYFEMQRHWMQGENPEHGP